MKVIRAMYSGISGLNAFKSALDVIGNNIANLNTTSFKAGRANFQDMLSQQISSATAPSGTLGGSNASQIGLGVFVGSVDINNTGGSMQATGRPTDLAIDGNGFFALGGGGKVGYTRDGGFSLDSEYNLTASGSGMKVLGWAADFDTGVIDTSAPVTAASGLKIPLGGLSVARATSQIDLTGNLNASSAGPSQTTFVNLTRNLDSRLAPVATSSAVFTGSFDSAAADGTTHDVALNVFDQNGELHPVTVTFTKNGASQWDYAVAATGADAASLPANGSLTFIDGVCNIASIPMNLTWNTGADSITASIDTSHLAEAATTNATASLVNGQAIGAPVVTSFNVYDSLGTAHQVTATFTKLPAANAWQYAITCPDADPASLPAASNITFTGGVPSVSNIPMSLTLAVANGSTTPLTLSVDTSGLTQVAAASTAAVGAQDGSMPGDPVEVKFDIYDSLGVNHKLQVNFTKTSDPATWDYQVVCPDATDASLPAPGQITFSPLGYSQLPSIALSLDWKNGNGSTVPLVATIDTSTISQLSGLTTADLSHQDGLEMGTLSSYDIGRDGVISGVFTNGSLRNLGQLALAQFNNPAGLTNSGGNVWTQSPNSGAAKIRLPGEAGLGLINSGYLEASNVDLATEFANMIVAQRGFQANSKIITTSDEVLQELVALKR